MIAAAGLMLAACTGDDDVLAVVDQQPAATDDAEGFTATMGDQLELLPEENLDGQTVNTLTIDPTNPLNQAEFK